jgi:hypothetical protein
MVYSRVEVWRGVILTVEELEALFESEWGALTEKDRQEKQDDFMCYIDNLALNLDKLLYNVKAKLIGDRHCGDFKPAVLVGIRINKFERLRFNILDVPEENRDLPFIKEKSEKNDAFCGKPLSLTDETRCGARYRCSQCIGLTINGNYAVREIYENIKECTTYCFKCNNDKCAASVNHLTDPLTIKTFIDEQILEVLSVIDESDELSERLKNYYRVDDCLCCT